MEQNYRMSREKNRIREVVVSRLIYCCTSGEVTGQMSWAATWQEAMLSPTAILLGGDAIFAFFKAFWRLGRLLKSLESLTVSLWVLGKKWK